jgi:hypothetical protein
MQGFYDNQIKELRDEIAQLQKRVSELCKKQEEEKYKTFQFSDEQINDAAVQLIVEKGSESDWDIEILDNFKEEIWNPNQLSEYDELSVDDQDEALWVYVDATRKRAKEILERLVKHGIVINPNYNGEQPLTILYDSTFDNGHILLDGYTVEQHGGKAQVLDAWQRENKDSSYNWTTDKKD